MQNTPRRKARIRTIREVIALLKQADSQTAVTYHFIRKLCDSGCIKSIRAGKKILINYDELLAYLNLDIDEAC
ncbi:MAG TPA: DNA-binding protein [Clostridiales bacterium]|nr:MAG: DNA-binding protein [Subdoligranulum sp.]HCW81140.1 DNA-binding protein [Clostridiales bacterium]